MGEERKMNILLCRKVFPYAPATAHSSPTSKMGAFWAVHCKGGYKFSPDDTQNYTAMLAEFRKQLGNNRLLSIAAPAGQDKYSKIQLNKISQYLNWINLMTFDYHGGWETQTDVHTNLPPVI